MQTKAITSFGNDPAIATYVPTQTQASAQPEAPAQEAGKPSKAVVTAAAAIGLAAVVIGGILLHKKFKSDDAEKAANKTGEAIGEAVDAVKKNTDEIDPDKMVFTASDAVMDDTAEAAAAAAQKNAGEVIESTVEGADSTINSEGFKPVEKVIVDGTTEEVGTVVQKNTTDVVEEAGAAVQKNADEVIENAQNSKFKNAVLSKLTEEEKNNAEFMGKIDKLIAEKEEAFTEINSFTDDNIDFVANALVWDVTGRG